MRPSRAAHDLIPVSVVAELAACTEESVRVHLRRGTLAGRRIANVWVVPREAAERFAEAWRAEHREPERRGRPRSPERRRQDAARAALLAAGEAVATWIATSAVEEGS